jgi:hypothetical protein
MHNESFGTNRVASNRRELSSIRNKLLPESTPVPNFVFDQIMPLVPHAEFKVLLVLVRKTIGWQKESDFVSLSQIMKLAGVSRDVAIAGTRLYVEIGLVRQTRSGYRGTNCFEILDYDKQDVISRLERLVERKDRSVSARSASRFHPTSPVDPTDTQKASTKKATIQKASRNSLSGSDSNGTSKFSEIQPL